MTQEERFEKWTFAQMEFITLRDAWRAALEPAELEFEHKLTGCTE